MVGGARRAGRQAPKARDTRADILDAARTQFADLGFERTTMRAVAARAGVDVALIYHYFGSKDGLLAAALSVPESAQSVLQPIPAGTVNPGRAVTATVLGMWETDALLRGQAIAMIRTALSHEVAAQRMRDLHSAVVAQLVAEVVAVDEDRDLRISLIGAHLSGLLLTRYLLEVPAMRQLRVDTLIAAAGPVIDHYLTGELAG